MIARKTSKNRSCLLGWIIPFVLGVFAGVIISSNSGCLDSTFLTTSVSFNEALKYTSGPIDKGVEFLSNHAQLYNLPEKVVKERFDECEGRKVSATGGFCLTKSKNIGGNQMFDRPLALYMANNIFKDQSVVDLGAGLGHYGKIFNEPDVPVKAWVGYDGAMNVKEVTDGLVRFMDLTQPHAADERPCVMGDWVLSLEVAEHIPVKHTDDYLRNIRCHARKGAVISWGRPEQTGGLGHVNTKTEEDAIKTVEQWGFKVDWELTRGLREVATLPHFKKTPVVYRVVS